MNMTMEASAPDDVRKRIPAKMKVAVLAAPRTITFEQQQVPEPDAGEALVQVEGCGLCASSDPVWQGRDWFDYPRPPGTPGHESWGRVVRAGKGSLSKEGDRVALLSGVAFAPFLVVKDHEMVPLPAAIDHLPFPGEPLGCVMNILDRAKVESDHVVVVLGLGFIGQLTTHLLASRGIRTIALSRRQAALDRAHAEAEKLRYTDHWAAIRQVMEMTGGRGAHRVIECTGHQIPLDMATDMVAEYGKIIIAGYHQDGLRQVDMQKWNWKAIDVVNAHERDPRRYVRGIQEAADLVAKGSFDPNDLISHWFPFEQLATAMELVSSNAPGLVKACIRFDR